MPAATAGLITSGLHEPFSALRSTPSARVRCACRRCGSHVQAVVLKQTISGRCGTCESYDIAPLGR